MERQPNRCDQAAASILVCSYYTSFGKAHPKFVRREPVSHYFKKPDLQPSSSTVTCRLAGVRVSRARRYVSVRALLSRIIMEHQPNRCDQAVASILVCCCYTSFRKTRPKFVRREPVSHYFKKLDLQPSSSTITCRLAGVSRARRCVSVRGAAQQDHHGASTKPMRPGGRVHTRMFLLYELREDPPEIRST